MAKLPHFYCPDNSCYFITTTTEGRTPIFAREENAAILWNTINNQRDRNVSGSWDSQ